MADPELPPKPETSADGIVDIIQETVTNPRLTVEAAREMAAADPEYARVARDMAFKLFPDDPGRRADYLGGTELRFIVDRKVHETQDLESMLEEPSAEARKPRRRRTGRMALLAVSMFAKPRKA